MIEIVKKVDEKFEGRDQWEVEIDGDRFTMTADDIMYEAARHGPLHHLAYTTVMMAVYVYEKVEGVLEQAKDLAELLENNGFTQSACIANEAAGKLFDAMRIIGEHTFQVPQEIEWVEDFNDYSS